MDSLSFFFDDVLRLIEGAERQYGVANINYTEYILERFEFCITTVTSVLNQLRTASDSSTPMREYCACLGELTECLRTIYYKWEEYEGILHSNQMSRMSYQAPVTHSGSSGRPRFEISKDQLIYLNSLSFTWTDIAALLCVSRMTIYRFVTHFRQFFLSTRIILNTRCMHDSGAW